MSLKIFYKIIKYFINLFALLYKHINSAINNNLGIPRIKIINLNATDVCNSRCVMCNIWQQEKEFEITAYDIRLILKNKLFKHVEHVGVTGGEPTLRNDLPEIFLAIIKTLPKIKGISMISNGIQKEKIIKIVPLLYKVCCDNNVSFNIMFSLDGINERHDLVRGVKNNFDNVIYLINHIDIPKKYISIGCTISKINVWDVDDLLFFLKKNNIYGRFRIAEFIKRLYNENNKTQIRNFTADEKYNLQLFFYKLIFSYEKNDTIKRTYYNIINMLEGGKRKIGCPYKFSEGIVLNAKGEIAYCAPKSNVIGNALINNANKIYRKNLLHKKEIIKKFCNDCIHDYHYTLTVKEYFIKIKQIIYIKLFKPKYNTLLKLLSKFYNSKNNKDITIFIVGWYGTETIGDKAILGGIIDFYRKKYFKPNIIVSSIYPIITKRTLIELNEQKIKVISFRSFDFVKYSKIAKEIVMGGGPLMNMEELDIPLLAFSIAKFNKKQTIIFGCGVGPIYGKYLDKLIKIIHLSDTVLVRDYESKLFLSKFHLKKNINVINDPAIDYVQKIQSNILVNQQNVLCCYLRELTTEYVNLAEDDFLKIKYKFEQALANFIKFKANELNVDEIILYHMHNFIVGNDDRDFSRRFINEHFNNYFIKVSYDKELSSIEKIVGAMKSSKLNICMRYHSVVFADTLNVPYLAIDYTNGGKIYGYMKDRSQLDKLFSIDYLLNNCLS